MRKRENKRCEICQSEKIKHFLEAKSLDDLESSLYHYLKCANCGLVFLEEKERFSDTQKAYEKSGYYSRKKAIFEKAVDLVLHHFNKQRLRMVLKYSGFRNPGKLLDIGCGKGRFLLEACSARWEVFGIEPNPRGYEIAVNKYKLNILPENISIEQFPDRYFDVITMWHVFEHISTPNCLLKIAYNYLKKGGHIFIAVPNIDSFQAKYGGKLWFNLDPPRHLYHYSPITLGLLLENNGFSVKKISHFYAELNYFGSIQTILNRLSCTPNFVFNFLKQNKKGINQNRFILAKDLLLTILIFIIVGVPLIFLTLLESFWKRGGTIVAMATKKENGKRK